MQTTSTPIQPPIGIFWRCQKISMGNHDHASFESPSTPAAASFPYAPWRRSLRHSKRPREKDKKEDVNKNMAMTFLPLCLWDFEEEGEVTERILVVEEEVKEAYGEDTRLDECSTEGEIDSNETEPDEEWMLADTSKFDERATSIQLRKEGLPIYVTFGAFKGVSLPALGRMEGGRQYLDQFLARKPGWFERGSVPANMALLRSLSRLRLLRFVTDLNGDVVPATRMVRNWELRQERTQQASRETRCLHRQRQRRRTKAALRKGSVALDRHMESEMADENRKDTATARDGDKARVPMRPPPPRVVRKGTGYQTPPR